MEEFFTPAEVAKQLKVCTKTITRLIDRGELNAVKIGNRRRVSESELRRFLEGNPAKPKEQPQPRQRRSYREPGLVFKYFDPV